MVCPNCNSLISEDINICNYCGTQLTYNTINNQDYIEYYVGNKYDEISKKGFNIFAFLLPKLYSLYRKEYKMFFLQLIITIIPALISSILFIIVDIIIRIFLGIKFNKIYLKNAELKIQKIKESNKEKTDEKIVKICKEKGGTELFYPLMIIFIEIFTITMIAITFIILSRTNNINFEEYYNNKYYYDTVKSDNVANLYYKIPLGFKEVTIKKNTKEYFLKNDDFSYYISIKYKKNHYYDTGEEYLIENYKTNNIRSYSINGTLWYVYKNNNVIYYSTIYNNNLYYITISIIGNTTNDRNFDYEIAETFTFKNSNNNK